MSRRGLWLAGLALSLIAGCLTDRQEVTHAWKDGFRKLNSGKTGNVVQIDVALIERPIGDPVVNTDVWNPDFTDEQLIPLDLRQLLAKNGFRVGQIVGATPDNLHSMLTSERSCANPRRLLVEDGKKAKIRLGPIVPKSQCVLHLAKKSTQEEWFKPHYSLEVFPEITTDGQTRLRFQPFVEHGENRSDFHAADDRSGWVMEVHRDIRTIPELAWEVTLPTNKYLVIGTWVKSESTLGAQSFIENEYSGPIQRLLVIRTNHSGYHGDDAQIAPGAPPEYSKGGPLPIALQAQRSTIRANY